MSGQGAATEAGIAGVTGSSHPRRGHGRDGVGSRLRAYPRLFRGRVLGRRRASAGRLNWPLTRRDSTVPVGGEKTNCIMSNQYQ